MDALNLKSLAEIQERLKAAHEAEQAKRAAQKQVAAVTGGQPRQRHEYAPDLEVKPVLDQIAEIFKSVAALPDDHTMRRVVAEEVDKILAANPKAAAEFHVPRLERSLSRFEGKNLPWHLASAILKSGVAKIVSADEAETLKAAGKEYVRHLREEGAKDDHAKKDCVVCQTRPDRVWESKEPSGSNAQRDIFFVVRAEGDLKRYAARIYRALVDWKHRSYEKRAGFAQACEAAGVEKNSTLTLADVAAGKVPGKSVVAFVSGANPLVVTNREGREYRNHGGFFVRQLTHEEAGKRGVRIPDGAAAMTIAVPEREVSGMWYPLNQFVTDRGGKERVYLYSLSDPASRPFDGLQDAHTRATPFNRGVRLIDVLRHAMGHKPSAGASSSPAGEPRQSAPQPKPIQREEPRREERKAPRAKGRKPEAEARGGARNLVQEYQRGKLGEE